MTGGISLQAESRARRSRLQVAMGVAGLVGLVAPLLWAAGAAAFPRYNDGCRNCHGDFRGPLSPRGTVFPGNSKHEMHRGAANMNTDCNLCHMSGTFSNPYIGMSAGTAANPGVGCTGCHGHDYGGGIGVTGAGLRAHHFANNVTVCAGCHVDDPIPLPEGVRPVYYGTADTRVDDPCNSAPGRRENWSVGDTLGLDNDGDNLYDQADPNCAVTDGDLNCDGTVDALDVGPFVLALTNPAAYPQQFPNCNIMNADINDDGVVDFLDVAAFANCLTGGGTGC